MAAPPMGTIPLHHIRRPTTVSWIMEPLSRKMFGREPTNMNPVYINDGIRTLAVYQYDAPEAVKIASVECAVDRQTWNVDVIDLWLNWVDGSLTFRRREFHTPSNPSES